MVLVFRKIVILSDLNIKLGPLIATNISRFRTAETVNIVTDEEHYYSENTY